MCGLPSSGAEALSKALPTKEIAKEKRKVQHKAKASEARIGAA
jgi:hypothetical protein